MSDSYVLVPDPLAPWTINTNAFSALPPATLQRMLTEATAALHSFGCGQMTAVVSYGEGSGQKSVTFSRTNEGILRNHIRELMIALGLRGRRRAIRVGF